MTISGSMGVRGLGSDYRVSSIHGNPYSMKAVKRIGEDSEQGRKSLILARKKPKDELYVKDYGELGSTKSTATGSFAELLNTREEMLSASGARQNTRNNYSDYLNDTIGVMGQNNRLREQLLGAYM